jgi:hypothetical protein
MLSLVRFMAAMVGALLPRQFRSRWGWASEASLRTPAIFSGFAEAAVCLALIIHRYFVFFEWRMGTIADAALRRGGGDEALGNTGAQFGAGFLVLVEYAIRPLTLLLIYFSIEGLVRLFAAWVGDECVGTMPLYLLAGGLEGARKRWREHQLGPRVPDEVQFCKGISYDLCVASCRPKPAWDRLITIEYNGELYELFDEKKGGPPRPHIYQLRILSPGRIIRGLHHYHPDEALTEKQRRASARKAAQENREARGNQAGR